MAGNDRHAESLLLIWNQKRMTSKERTVFKIMPLRRGLGPLSLGAERLTMQLVLCLEVFLFSTIRGSVSLVPRL